MPVLRTRDVDRALVNKLGFERLVLRPIPSRRDGIGVEGTETHHHVYRLWLGGKLAARTYISHGGRELSRYHVSQMAKQMQLRTAEFVDAVNCPLSREDYYRLLRERVPDLGEE